jgi:DNA-binding response OmpR family regulator/class 3 adenylate cyclase
MALIIVCEDDASTRALITAVLSKAGHDVEAFDNGLKAYVRLLEGDAELLISDVQMPLKNGFELLADIRHEPSLVNLPCILLTSLAEREHMRTGMTSGADDYVTKPFQPAELLEAADSQLKRAMQRYLEQMRHVGETVDKALGEKTTELMTLYEDRLSRELQARWDRTDSDPMNLSGCMIACSYMEPDAWQRCLPEPQLADLAKLYFGKLADSAALFGADHVQFVGEGLLIMLDEQRDTPSVNHVSRSLRLVESLTSVRASVQAHTRSQWANFNPPGFMPCMVVHAGAISLAKLEGITGGIDQLVPVGQAVTEMNRLLKTAQVLRWPLAVSGYAWPRFRHALREEDRAEIKLKTQAMQLYRAALA